MPERTPLIAGNWKMFKTRTEAAEFCEALKRMLPVPLAADLAVCPPFTALETCKEKLSGSEVAVFAQTMHQEDEGAYTGEVSRAMLLDLGIDGVVLGHSERRQLFGETDRALKEKVVAALERGLTPVLCVGETEEEREADETERKLRQQVQEGLEKAADEALEGIVIAYEPIWAIGTGRVATPDQAQDAIAFIRALVGDRSKEAAERVRVLYGGSVKPDNAAEILAQPDIDGALVGGASLDAESFMQIVHAAG
jgi:triosephosphate isomerase (TIM)